MTQRVLFGTSAWGLGHATRDLVLLRALVNAGCQVSVVSTGPALRVLRAELDGQCEFLDWPDMPTTISRTTAGFILRTSASVPQILALWAWEARQMKKTLAAGRFDAVVTDHRFGLVTDRVPCYFITHSPRFIAPARDPAIEFMIEFFMNRWLRRARKVLIPDDPVLQMSGVMSHDLRFMPPDKLVFLGFLASLRRVDVAQDVDIFVTISGPEPQRTMFQQVVLKQAGALPGRVVVALGLPGQPPPPAPPNVELHAYLDRGQQQTMMNRAKLVVCRSGYTTLMELAQLGKPALLIPTPGQTEQIYLGQTLEKRGLFHCVEQQELDLGRDVEKARRCPGCIATVTPEQAAQRFLQTVLEN